MTFLSRSPATLALAFRSSLSVVRSLSLSNQMRSKRSVAATSEGGVFGLRPPDYLVIPPIRASPPPPPAKPGLQKYLWAITVTFSAVTVGYFYVNNNNDNYEYWWVKNVEIVDVYVFLLASFLVLYNLLIHQHQFCFCFQESDANWWGSAYWWWWWWWRRRWWRGVGLAQDLFMNFLLTY
jgi:hypothetical protein